MPNLRYLVGIENEKTEDINKELKRIMGIMNDNDIMPFDVMVLAASVIVKEPGYAAVLEDVLERFGSVPAK